MPISDRDIEIGRMDVRFPLTDHDIEALVSDARLKVLQIFEPAGLANWRSLNDRLFGRRPDVGLRVWGVLKKCDLTFLRKLPNLHAFSATLHHATGAEAIAELPELESLSIDIWSLENFDFLARLPSSKLTTLSLGATKSKKPKLGLLERFSELRTLYLAGQQKEIDVISRLPLIEHLALWSITVDDLAFVRALSHLWSLSITLGGTNNLSDLAGLIGIKYFGLRQVRGVTDISVISSLRGLQYLFLQSLPHITALPDLSKLRALRRLHMENLKSLADVSALAKAPGLEELMHCATSKTEPAQYFDLLKRNRLRKIFVGFGSSRKNEELQDKARAAGIQKFKWNEFSFV